VAEAEAAGGSTKKKPRGPSPRKTLRGEETFLLCLDRAKATAEHGRTEPIELEGDPEDLTEGGRPKKPKTTKAPPVTQEDDGFGDLASEEEEFREDDVVDEELDANGIAARDAATRESIPARPRGARRNSCGRPKNSFPRSGDDLDDNDDEELNATHDEATLESISACTRRAKRDGDANDRPRGAWRDGGADTIGPTAAVPRILSPGRATISTMTTTRSSTLLATKRRLSPSRLALVGPSTRCKQADRRQPPQDRTPQDDQ